MKRYYNARIMTLDPKTPAGDTAVFAGELWIDGDRIAYVGDGSDAPSAPSSWEEERDCRNNLLMPGLKNAHTHSAMTFLRSNADDLPLLEWLNKQVFPYEAKLTAEDIEVFTKLAILEYVSTGTTAVMEMYLDPPATARAFAETGMRAVQTSALNDFSQPLSMLEEWYLSLNGKDPYTSFVLGFHAEYTTSKDKVETIAALAEKYKAPVFTHLAETAAEVAQCRERYDMSPVAFLAKCGIFAYGGAGYHMVHTTEEDLGIIQKYDIGVVTNPGSNLKLASGIAPIHRYLNAGVRVAIGTDGPASNNGLDMLREMYLTATLGKVRENDASVIPAEVVLRMACAEGARLMQLPDADCLAPGKYADFILLDMEQPNMQPENNIARNIVYSGRAANVMLTVIGGEVRYERGEDIERAFRIGESVRDLYAEAKARRDALLG